MTRPPDFICVGAQKSGTTWLYEQLRRHPCIHIPAKELNVFYKDLPLEAFAGAAAEQIVGDISPVYGAAPGIAAKIARACPGARLVMLIRDPVERAWSQYKMAVRLGNIPREMPFIDAFFDDRQWLQRRGRYAEIIAEFSGVGPLLVLDFARVASEPKALLTDVYRFLGLDPVIDEPSAAAMFAAGPDQRALATDDAVRIADYYRPHNARLANLLPWRPSWLDL